MPELTEAQRRRHVDRLSAINKEFRGLERRMTKLQDRRGQAYVAARKAGLTWIEIAKASGGVTPEAVRNVVQRVLGTTKLSEVFGRTEPEAQAAAD